ncbi:MAG: T9SS type A sorting domain-containing protein, partial [bacterium]|nr:T9SS type A sorting domain-containing protein [bacterium]
PVELAAFKAEVIANSVRVQWTTISECENYGFDVERSQDGVNFQKVQFIKGYGTTNVAQRYSFIDDGLSVGKYYYRLKQIDFDGRSKFSELIAVEVASPNVFRLSQNYPNPFNSETTISFQVASSGYVTLTIYNILGRKIKMLFAENANPGYYRAQWNGYDAFGNAVSSGFYYLQMESQSFKETRRIVYLK